MQRALAASSFPLGLRQRPLLVLQVGHQIGNQMGVQPQSRHLVAEARQQLLQLRAAGLGEIPSTPQGRHALLAQGRDVAGERRQVLETRDDAEQQRALAHGGRVLVVGESALVRLVRGGLGLGTDFRERAQFGSPGDLPSRVGGPVFLGRREVDEIAQMAAAFAQLAPPPVDPRDQHRDAAEARQKRRLGGLDALGQRDLLLARQQFAAAHLAEIGGDQVGRGPVLIGPADAAGHRRVAGRVLSRYHAGRARLAPRDEPVKREIRVQVMGRAVTPGAAGLGAPRLQLRVFLNPLIQRRQIHVITLPKGARPHRKVWGREPDKNDKPANPCDRCCWSEYRVIAGVIAPAPRHAARPAIQVPKMVIGPGKSSGSQRGGWLDESHAEVAGRARPNALRPPWRQAQACAICTATSA